MARASAARRSTRATATQIAKQLAKHPCGECATCCCTEPVPELGKPEGLPCTRLRAPEPGQGACGAYRARPGSCAGFQCLWRLGALDSSGAMLTQGRPDRLGILFTIENTHASGIQLLKVLETRHGALDANMALLHELAAKGHVLYLIDRPHGDERCRMMGPEERVKAIKEAARRKLPLVSQ